MQNLIDKAQRNRSLRKSLINLKHGTKLWIVLNCVKIWSSDVLVRNVVLRVISSFSGFGGLGVACWPLVPKFAGSNPAEAVGFLGAKKSSARLPSEGK